jgi:GrpB-like predicted nucleotidyltransferase (UPF0157 family)
MRTHPLWRPFEQVSDEEILAARVTDRPRAPTTIEVVPYDEAWPAAYDGLDRRVRDALGGAVIGLEHVGSTAVPGLAAKPMIDVDLVVADPTDEAAYVPALESVGFVLRLREPDFHEHRLLRHADPACNLHVFGPGTPEVERHVRFRDWLRVDAGDRALYEDAKRVAAAQGFTEGMHYNNHKGGVVYDIYERIFAADPAYPHDPHPRGT